MKWTGEQCQIHSGSRGWAHPTAGSGWDEYAAGEFGFATLRRRPWSSCAIVVRVTRDRYLPLNFLSILDPRRSKFCLYDLQHHTHTNVGAYTCPIFLFCPISPKMLMTLTFRVYDL